MVIPFSLSRSIESRTRSATASPARKAPDWRSMASTSVVLPWSTWATIATLRMSVLCMGPPRLPAGWRAAGRLPAPAMLLHAPADQLPPGLQVPVAHPFDVGGDTELRTEAVEVHRVLARVHPHLGGDPFAVTLGEVHGDVGHLGEEVHLRGERRQGAVDE